MPNMVRPIEEFAQGSALQPVDASTEAKRKYLQEIAAKKAYIQSLQTQDSDVPVITDTAAPQNLMRPDPKDFYPPVQKPEQLNPPTTGIGKVLRSRGMARRQKGPEGPFTSAESFRQQLGGVTWGASDEMGAAAAALADTLRNGGDFAQNYDVIKKYMANRKQQYREANPSRAAGEEMVGAITSGNLVRAAAPLLASKVPGLAKAAGAAKKALTPAAIKALDMAPASAKWLGRYIKQAAPVIAEGALYGYATGEGDERGESAAESAALTGLLKGGGDVVLGTGKVLAKALSGTKELFGRAGPAGPRISKELGVTDTQIDRMIATREMLGVDATRESVMKELGERGVDFTSINAATEAGTGLHTFYKQIVGAAYGGGDVRKQTAKSIAKLEEIVTKEEMAARNIAESGNLAELQASGGIDNALHTERARLNGLKAEELDQELGRFDMAAQTRAEALEAGTEEVEVGLGRERVRLEEGDIAGRAQEEARLAPKIARTEEEFAPQVAEIEFGAQTQRQQIEREHADMMARVEEGSAKKLQAAQSDADVAANMLASEQARGIANQRTSIKQANADQVNQIDDALRRDVYSAATPVGASDDVIKQLQSAGPREADTTLVKAWKDVGWPEIKGQTHDVAPDKLIEDILSELKGQQDESAAAIAAAIERRLAVPEGAAPGSIHQYTGDELMEARNALRGAASGGDRPASKIARSAVAKGVEKIDKMLRDKMTSKQQKIDFRNRLTAYGNFRGAQDAMDNALARGGEFSPEEWLMARKPMHKRSLRGGKGPVQVEADAAIAQKAQLKELLSAKLEEATLAHGESAPLLRKKLGREHTEIQEAIKKQGAKETSGLKAGAEQERKDLTKATKAFLDPMAEDKTVLTSALKAAAAKAIADIDAGAAKRTKVLDTLEKDELKTLNSRAKTEGFLDSRRHKKATKGIESKYSELKAQANTKAKQARAALKTKGVSPGATPAQEAVAKAKASLPPDSVGSRVLATSMLGLAGGLPAWALGTTQGTLATLAAGASAGKALSQPGAQTFVAGQLPAQRRLAELLREYELSQAPEMLMQLRRPIERVAAEHLKR